MLADLPLAVPLVAPDFVLEGFKEQFLLPQLLDLSLVGLHLPALVALHLLYLRLQFLDSGSGNLQLVSYFSSLSLLEPDGLELTLVLLENLRYLFVLISKNHQFFLLQLLYLLLISSFDLYLLNLLDLELLILLGDLLLLLLVFLLEVLLLLLNELDLLVDLLVVLVVFDVEAVVQLLYLPQLLLLHFPHPALELIDFAAHLEHALVFLLVLLHQLVVSLLLILNLLLLVLDLHLEPRDAFLHGLVILPLNKNSLLELP